ncbi:MAG: IS1634 family transposase [Acholeplasmataceae bacterium]|nr:IS1634 family transposase [Acholeplasmataceae bacterium]
MRLTSTKTKNAESFYAIKTVKYNGKQTTRVVEKLGTLEEIKARIGEDKDPYQWAKEYVQELNRKEKEETREIIMKYSPSRQIKKDDQRLYNVGYLFLQKIYHDLGLEQVSETINRKYKYEYDLDEILSRLVYGRILFPSSKLNTFEQSKEFVEPPTFDLHQVYRALEIISKESDTIETCVYKNSKRLAKRNTGILYYDCSNFYFEIEKADGIKQYGISKEHRPNPIVQMGLFMDGNGIPLAFSIFDGNQNEQKSLKPLEKRIISDFGMSKFVVCTDAGLASTENRIFNTLEDRSFIVTQSLKKLKAHLVEWSLDPSGWQRAGDKKKYNLVEIDETKFIDSTFYKERWTNENGFSQKLIVTYSVKYKLYQKSVRLAQIDRAKKLASSLSNYDRTKQNDPKRFISDQHLTKEGQPAEDRRLEIDENIIADEERFDGFYAACTNLDDEAPVILEVIQRRWEIEECFRIMKSELRARPVYLSREDRIRAHFVTCFLALVIFRLLEAKLPSGYTCPEIVRTLRNMRLFDLDGNGFTPAYTRTDLTDAMHDAFGFRTDFQAVNPSALKRIIKMTHS